jgi:hypothetical protein
MRTMRKTAASSQRSQRRLLVGGALAFGAMLLAMLTAGTAVQLAWAADSAAAVATKISDSSFAMLNSLNEQSGGGKSNPALGAIAIFAGDAQTLSHTLASGDHAGAAAAMASLEADRVSVEHAGAANPGAFDRAKWAEITRQLDALARQVPSAAAASAAPSTESATAAASAPSVPSVASSAPSGAPAGLSTSTLPREPASAPPRVVIDSRTPSEGSIRIKGYLEGTHLTRGGLYDGVREVRDFNVGGVLGQQRLNFEIGVGNPPPGAVIRVYDAQGRMAEAPINDAPAVALGDSTAPATPATVSTAPSTDGAVAPEVPPLAPPSMAPPTNAPSTERGVEVFRNSASSGDSGGASTKGANIAEIPTHGAPRRSPSKRHTIGGQLGNVRIEVIATNEVQSVPPTYEVIGQIHGRGITHAAIYLNGRPVATIPVDDMSDNSSFDQRFVAAGGGKPSIRAYGVGDQFVESSIDLGDGLGNGLASADDSMDSGAAMPGETMPGTIMPGPMIGGAPGIVVQISAVGPITSNLYVVSGVISGPRLSAAGLYQNGMLVQSIPVRGGLSGMLGSLLSGGMRNVNFTARFNPHAGPATIRAFGSSGEYAEQPVMTGGGGTYGVSPYAGVNPYGAYSPYSPYGSPYGMSPYGNPYGMSPYGTNPYASGIFGSPPVNTYATPTNPFAPAPARRGW